MSGTTTVSEERVGREEQSGADGEENVDIPKSLPRSFLLVVVGGSFRSFRFQFPRIAPVRSPHSSAFLVIPPQCQDILVLVFRAWATASRFAVVLEQSGLSIWYEPRSLERKVPS